MIMLVVRFLMAAAFATSAIAKINDREGVRRALGDFGVRREFIRWVAPLLIGAELALVPALIVPASAAAAGWAALVFVAALTGVIIWNIGHGRRPDCHCFGRLSAGAVGLSTVGRNALLAVGALAVGLGGRNGWFLVAIGVIATGLWLGPPTRRRWNQRTGAKVAPFSLSDGNGGTWTLDDLVGRARPLLLVFTQPGCGACQFLMPDIARWQADGRTTVAVVTGGPEVEPAADLALDSPPPLMDSKRRVFAGFSIDATPAAVLIDRDGRLEAKPAFGAGEIENLVARAVEEAEQPVLTRRRVNRALFGLAAVTVVPAFGALVSACGSSRSTGGSTSTTAKNEVNVDGAWLCNQRYALCSSAACEPSKTNPKVSICRCDVLDGYSMGYKSCAERAPSGTHLVSTFSTQNVTSAFSIMTCSADVPWANCLDVTCQIDPANPTQAVCDCPIVDKGPSFTFGGKCNTATCTEVVWSGAAPPGVPFGPAMKKVGQVARYPKPCPTS